MSSFTTLGVPARLDAVLAQRAITTPTPIQAATLPDSLAGRDVLGRGRTGSGKTLAFALPVVARLSGGAKPKPGRPRALVLAPTRELASQIAETLDPLAATAGLRTRTVFGGVGQQPQVSALQRGVDIVVACPGRLEDLIGQGHCSLADVEITVLDEADHMADLGFLPGVRRLLSQTPKGGQRMLFSATLDRAVDALVKQFLSSPVVHEVDGGAEALSPVETMEHHVLQVERDARLPVLVNLTSAPGRTVVFTRTKHGAKGLAARLNRSGVPAVELHGNLGQNARTRNLDAFHSGRASVLVATDIAARGIHVDDVARVVHSDPPADHKAYLHRSGRTARAGNAGTVVTLMTGDQRREVRALTRAAGISPITTVVTSSDDPALATIAPGPRELRGAFEPPKTEAAPAPAKSAGGGRAGSSRRRSGQRGGNRGGHAATTQSGRQSQPGGQTGNRSRRSRGSSGRPSGQPPRRISR